MEILLTSALVTAGLPVVVVNPPQVRDFAKANGRLAKTDALDAQMLAQFAEVTRPPPRPLPDAEARALAELLTRRRLTGRDAHGREESPPERRIADPQQSADTYHVA
jgi:transposase